MFLKRKGLQVWRDLACNPFLGLMRPPVVIRDLGDVEALYHEDGCKCDPCLFRDRTQPVYVKKEDLFRGEQGRIYSVAELEQKQAGDRLAATVKHYVEQKWAKDEEDALRILAEKAKHDREWGLLFARYYGRPVVVEEG